MPDPFEQLQAPVVPTDPEPAFAANLRARVERALTLPKGVTVSDLASTIAPPVVPTASLGAVTPYLAVRDARAAIDWYREVFGSRLRSEPIEMPDGRIGHAELVIGTSVVMLADEFADIGHVAPTGPGSPVSLHVDVDDVDSVVARAVAGGADLTRGPYESEHGRGAALVDPFGHRWLLTAPVPIRHGDIVYTSLHVPDVQRAQTFFRDVVGIDPHHGFFHADSGSTLFVCFAVDDVSEAAERVVAAGGRAGEPHQAPHGVTVDCVDNQGMEFALWQRETFPRPGAAGWRPGDLTYVTFEVRDGDAFRSFFGSVLGWRFSPGHVPDGWQIADIAPLGGVHGGHDDTTVVPMYVTGDIDEAVQRVRSAGGTATAAERQPYGISSTCTDDQGTRFYLIEYGG
jgi:predicted enzyme related to lactoylglutathione lyase